MEASADWPGKPKRGHALNTSYLSNRRRWQVEQLAELAKLAEGYVSGTDEYGDPVMLEESSELGSPRLFVRAVLAAWIEAGGFGNAPEDGKFCLDAMDSGAGSESGFFEVADPREARLSPIPGDVLIFHDGHVAICVRAQCYGCHECEVVEFTSTRALEMGAVPCIWRTIAWLSNVKTILRAAPERITPGDPEKITPEKAAEGSAGEDGAVKEDAPALSSLAGGDTPAEASATEGEPQRAQRSQRKKKGKKADMSDGADMSDDEYERLIHPEDT